MQHLNPREMCVGVCVCLGGEGEDRHEAEVFYLLLVNHLLLELLDHLALVVDLIILEHTHTHVTMLSVYIYILYTMLYTCTWDQPPLSLMYFSGDGE